jgi:putative membrane protein
VWSVVDEAAAPPGGAGPQAAAAARDGDGALALYLWTWIGETFASAVLWRRPKVALAGGAAMGAFAVPALFARRR